MSIYKKNKLYLNLSALDSPFLWHDSWDQVCLLKWYIKSYGPVLIWKINISFVWKMKSYQIVFANTNDVLSSNIYYVCESKLSIPTQCLYHIRSSRVSFTLLNITNPQNVTNILALSHISLKMTPHYTGKIIIDFILSHNAMQITRAR